MAFAATSANAQAVHSITPLEQKMIASVDAHNAEDRALLEKIVDINSGTMNLPGVVAVKDVLAPRFEALGFTIHWEAMDTADKRAGDLVAEHPCPQGDGKCGKRLLLIGHMDTVFEPASSFQKYSVMPDTDGKIVTGPGVDDMKGGLVVMLAALRAMEETGALDHAQISIVLSGDEERHGEPVEVSRRDMIAAGKRCDVALEFEPSGRFSGKDSVSTGRRSANSWRLETTGLSGHSSQIFGDRLGYGAIYEIVRILDEFRVELPEEGLTYNVGLLLGGATAERERAADGRLRDRQIERDCAGCQRDGRPADVERRTDQARRSQDAGDRGKASIQDGRQDHLRRWLSRDGGHAGGGRALPAVEWHQRGAGAWAGG